MILLLLIIIALILLLFLYCSLVLAKYADSELNYEIDNYEET